MMKEIRSNIKRVKVGCMEIRTMITCLLSVLVRWNIGQMDKKRHIPRLDISFMINPAMAMIKTFLVGVSVYICFLQPGGVYAQITADASVNGKLRTIIKSEGIKPRSNGVSIAAGKIFNPVKEDYRVSRKPKVDPNTGELVDDGNKPANTDEVKNLQSLIGTIKGGILGPEALATEIKDKTKPTDRPERFKEVSKKIFPLLAEINKLSNPDALEEAEAFATTLQGGLTGATFTLEENPKTRVEKKAARNPMAVALAVDRDPLAVKWKRVPDQEVTVDLSEVSLTAATIGSRTSAFALFGSDVSFINNNLNIHLAEDQAAPLYEFLISFVSTNGEPPALDVLELETFGNEISDSLENVGIDNVRDGLLSQLTQIGDATIGFISSYSFTVKVPGSPSKSVLFLRDLAITSVAAEGEEET
jgi:hypothetical protein